MRQIVEHIFARRDVDLHIAPLLGRNVGEPAFHQCFAGGDDLNDSGVAGVEIALDRFDQRRGLHRGDQVREEALLRGFEGRARGGLRLRIQCAVFTGDVGRLHRGIQIVMDDLEGAGIGVVNPDLLRRERVHDQLIFDAFIGERARGIEAERFEIAGQHFHRRDAAGLDRLHEFGAGGEGKIFAAPEAEPLGIGKIMHRRRAGGGDIDNARIGQRMLQAQSRAALLRRRLNRRARLCRRRRSPWRGFRRTR